MNKYYLLVLFLVFSGHHSALFAQGADCPTSTPFCTGTNVSFPNSTNVPDLGTLGCLGTSPNPAWYYMQISNPGNLILNISQVSTSGAGIDVDFICWGPFNTLADACAINFASTPSADCSYSANANETCTLNNVLTGQIYILLLTNFSNNPGTISFTDSSATTASTDCGIVCNAPNLSIGPALHLDCTNAPVILSGISNTPGVTFHWTGPNGFTSNAQFPSTNVAGNYTLTVIDPAFPNCPSSAHELVDAANTGAPNVSTTPSVSLTCTTNSVSLNSSSTTPNVSYSWTGPGGFTSNLENPTGITLIGTYTVKVTDPANGCKSTATETVSLNNTAPYGTTGFTQQLTCAIHTVSLSSSSTTAGATFSWTGPGGFTSNLQNPSGLSVAGGYTVTFTNPANGCTSTATQFITANTTPPTIGTGVTQTITCTTTQVSLSVNSTTSGLTINWTGPGGFTSSSAAPTNIQQPGIYNVTITNPANGCTATASQTVLNNTTLPNITPCSNQVLTCTNTSVNLSATSTTAGVNYSWSGPNGFASTNQYLYSLALIGVYNVSVVNPANGCVSSSNVAITIDTVSPNLSVGTTQTLTCSTTSVNLFSNSTTNNVIYNWSGPNNFTSNLSNPSGVTLAGNYTINIIDTINGCHSSALQTVTSNTVAPNVSVGADQTITCIVNTVDLAANSTTANAIYNWSGVAGFTSAIQNPSGIINPGNYTVTVTDPVNGCTSFAVQKVLLNITHPILIMGAQQTLNCIVLTVNLTANSPTLNTIYNWSGPNGFVAAIKNPSGIALPGTYSVTVTDTINGCTSTDIQTVILDNTPPDLSVGPTQNLTCYIPSVKLFSSSNTPNALFLWSDSTSFSSNLTQPTVTAPGNYYITVTNPENGCKTSSVEKINSLIAYPVINFTANNYSGCQPLTVRFADHSTVSSGTIISREWSFGNGDSDFVINPSTIYLQYGKFPVGIKVLSSIGCETDTVIDNYIDVYRKPIADFRYTPDNPSIFLPVVDFVDYSQGNPTDWKWDFSDHKISVDQNPSHTFLKTGKYDITLIVTTDEGCKDTTMQIIDVKEEYALYAPTAFTPNNDGENDLFFARGVGITKFSMLLFDRWGKLYFTSEDLSKGWDGMVEGEQAPQGVYIYKINYTDFLGGKHEYLNTITLIR